MSLRFIQILFISSSIFLASLNALTEASEVFHHINLDYPGLEKVKNALQNGNIEKAEYELLEYFKNRTNRSFSDFKYEYDKQRADKNIRNVFTIKNSTIDFGDEIDWTKVHGENQWKFSLNRMKWLENFAGLYWETGDEKYVRAWMNHIESWIRIGDPGYPRTIDTGRRLQHWIVSYWALVPELKSPTITPEFHARMLMSMVEQAQFSYQSEHWRRYSNWGTFENSGLSLFVIMFPEFKSIPVYMKEIWFRMYYQMEESYHDDGMHIEVSPSYHSHELKVWFDFIRYTTENGIESPWHSQIPLPTLKELFLKPSKALMHTYKPTGVFPQVGDTDETDERNILLELGEFWDWPDLVYVATDGQEGEPPVQASTAYPEGGYFIMRSGWGNDALQFDEELYLLFDCGTNHPWHAHYDMLNIVVTAYGQDLLKDAGRFTYNQGKERDYFKSTSAHNTIVIDGMDQPRRYTPPKAEWHSLSGFDYVIGSYSYNPDVSHVRSVFFAKPEYWIIIDRLYSIGSHHYDQYWHFNDKALGKVTIKEQGHRVIVPHLQLFSLAEKTKASMEEGYISYNYRQKIKAPVLRYSLNGESATILPTVLYPYKSEMPEIKVERLEVNQLENQIDSSGAIAFRISSVNYTDFFFEQNKSNFHCIVKGLETDAKMVFIRFDDRERIMEYHMVGGSYFNYAGKRIAHIIGTEQDISVLSDRVEIVGNYLFNFQLEVQGTPEVFLNGHSLEVQRKAGTISFIQRK